VDIGPIPPKHRLINSWSTGSPARLVGPIGLCSNGAHRQGVLYSIATVLNLWTADHWYLPCGPQARPNIYLIIR